MRISDWSSDVCSSDLLLEADLRMRVEVAPPGGDLLLQGGDAVVVAAGKDRGGRDGGGHLGFPPRRAALPPVSHAEPVDRKSVVSGKSVSVRVSLGGRRSIQKKKTTPQSTL